MATIVEQIKSALAKRDGISEEAMRPLAGLYASEVNRVNSRLSSAVALLQKGLRSEAIQSASIHPNAIDDAAKLDFAEAEDWFDILQFLGIDVPPSLQRDLADQLNEAIVDTQPLDVLLKKHRRLAIARAPLSWRLKTLRRIADIDSMNGVWEDDIESWEKARLKQIAMAVPAALANSERELLRELAGELEDQAWRVQADPSTLRNIKAKLSQLDNQTTRDELAELAPLLHDAFCEFDENKTRALLTRWTNTVSKLSGDVPLELAYQVDGAVEWVAEMDREAQISRDREQAIGALEKSLDRGAPLSELERVYHRAMTFDEPPLMELLQRYHLACEERTLGKKRKFQAIVGSVLALTLVVVASLAWWQYKSIQAEKIATAENEFRSLVSQKNLSSAASFYENLQQTDPEIAATPGIMSLSTQLTSLVNEENLRAQQFADYLSSADADDAADIDVMSLNRAEALAASESEKAAVFKIRRRQSQWQAGLTEEHTNGLLAAIAKERNELSEIEGGNANEQTLNQIDSVVERLGLLNKSFQRATREARDQIVVLRNRADAMRIAVQSSMLSRESENDALKRIRSASSLDELARQLRSYASEFPESGLGAEFGSAAAEAKFWTVGLTWNDYLDASAKALRSGMNSNEVAKQREVAKLFSTQVTRPPAILPAAASERLSLYDKRVEILSRVLGGLKDAVMSDLVTVIESAEGRNRVFVYDTYYERNRETKFARNDTTPSRTIEAVTDAAGSVKSVSVAGATLKILTEPRDSIDWMVSQYKLRQRLFLADWDGEFLKLAAELRDRKELDGQLKELLLQHILGGACEGSTRLSEGLVNELQTLKNASTAKSTWYLPSTLDFSIGATIESNVIPRLATLYRSRPLIANEVEPLKKLRCQWVGILQRENNGTVFIELKATASANGPLMVIRESTKVPDSVDWVEIGSVDKGVATLQDAKVDWVAGRPVFAFTN